MSINDLQLNLISNPAADNKLSELAARVAIDKFDYRYATLLFLNYTMFYSAELFLRAFNSNIIVSRGIFNSKLIKVSLQYVIFGSDIFELEQLLDTLKEQEMKNTGKFIVVCESEDVNECNENKIMRLFWDFRIVNVVFIKYEKFEAVGFTYFPFLDGDCNNTKPIKLKVSNCSQYSTTDYGEIFEMKRIKLNLCPLFVSTFIQTPFMNISNGKPVGADGDLVRMIAYGLNTTVKMMTPHRGGGWGFREKNGTWMGSLGDIYDDLANISITSAAITLTRFSDFQISRSYYSSHVVWVTHPAKLQNEALKLFYPFREDARMALIVCYVLVILCAFVVKSDTWSSICRGSKNNVFSKSIVFHSWMICMGQALKLPTKSIWLQMTILWIYYCFIIRTAYQVYLISSLKGKFYEDQFETIEDAIKARYPFGGGAALRDYYINFPVVYNSWMAIDTDKIVPTVLNMSKGETFVIAMNWDTAKMIIKEHKVNLHILPQKVICSPTVIFFKKYSPIADSINIIMSRLVASGFPEMLHKKYTSILRTVDTDDEYETLKLLHFTACYAVLVTGWILCLIFFSLEIYFGKIYKHPTFSQ